MFKWKSKNGVNAEKLFQQNITNWLKSKGVKNIIVNCDELIDKKCDCCGQVKQYIGRKYYLKAVDKVWENIKIPLDEKIRLTLKNNNREIVQKIVK